MATSFLQSCGPALPGREGGPMVTDRDLLRRAWAAPRHFEPAGPPGAVTAATRGCGMLAMRPAMLPDLA